ncbi:MULTISPECIES: type II secretion system F family protein [unclassified Cryobacterium]|uniref:type II secretion system F family protein n=1 Tax=unclassified Cryobacterium TaxID=2649013 RepID=UPI00106B9E97|nr:MULTISPECIES: type II secretion system F family protein [unclassified Cryobacterium]TFC56940.1 type II secretion system F family protein [Cryobacterium sp. TMB3-1-2]TFC67897.1 type II secretion system F family protein [Cryobacterium sp. TMB3-15]TFC76816.1 type II secretion system F family protein [Cryobacterium sp. TMB3-10]TFD42233.1 type II secretion system F family protein [Cryobacterium sp. TMB3-12]
MPTAQTYAYKARDTSGKVVKGKVDAPSEVAVTSRLRTMGLTPVSITEANAGTGLQRDIQLPGMKKAISLKDLAVMSRQMATMTSSGLTLLRTLNILTEQTDNKQLAEILGAIRTDVETGISLSSAMAKHPTVLPPIMINLVRAGETGGFLEKALNSVAANFESEVKLRSTIKSALAYPVIVLIMAVVAVIGMLIFIVPVFEGMFKGLGGDLPIPTQILVVLSRIMVWLGPLLVVLGVAFSFWWRQNKNTEAVRKRIDPIKLKLPVFGSLMTKLAIARFSRNFSTMIGAGVPIMQSLAIVGETSGNWVIEKALRNVQDSVRKGESIAGPLMKEPIFPNMVTQMIAVGEDSGALEQMLNKVADFYDEEVQSTTEQLTALIEPLMIAFIGVVVGGMIVALYMPMFSIFDYVK